MIRKLNPAARWGSLTRAGRPHLYDYRKHYIAEIPLPPRYPLYAHTEYTAQFTLEIRDEKLLSGGIVGLAGWLCTLAMGIGYG